MLNSSKKGKEKQTRQARESEKLLPGCYGYVKMVQMLDRFEWHSIDLSGILFCISYSYITASILRELSIEFHAIFRKYAWSNEKCVRL